MATTILCGEADHSPCYGYVAPLVYSTVKPCECGCHGAENPRDLDAALNRAIDSFYASMASREGPGY
jgi:hypothetical protein